MKSLAEIYEKHNGRLVNKWFHYIEIYDQWFAKYRNTDLVFLEIGLAHGGSLQIWREYFGEKATIIGVDINPKCKIYNEGNTKIFIGSQEDPSFLDKLKSETPKVDILLDDGGHTMKQQNTTFDVLFDHVKDDGLYMCEDVHTSYWKNFGGGLRKKNSFIERSKSFIENINAWHITPKHKPKVFNAFTKSMYGIHFYDSIVLIEKKIITEPKNTFKGFPSTDVYDVVIKEPAKKSFFKKVFK
jgi:hypothetical protein